MPLINKIVAREILDSRGNPTIEEELGKNAIYPGKTVFSNLKNKLI